jgi:hypothetical protein
MPLLAYPIETLRGTKMNLTIKIAGVFALAYSAAAIAQSAAAASAPMPTDFSEGERWDWRATYTPDIGADSGPTRMVVIE